MSTVRVEVQETTEPSPPELPAGWELSADGLTATKEGNRKKELTAHTVTGFTPADVLWAVAAIEEAENG